MVDFRRQWAAGRPFSARNEPPYYSSTLSAWPGNGQVTVVDTALPVSLDAQLRLLEPSSGREAVSLLHTDRFRELPGAARSLLSTTQLMIDTLLTCGLADTACPAGSSTEEIR